MEKALNNYELMSLNKALFYIRFNCTDYEATNIKCSSLLVESHLKILNELSVYYKSENLDVSYDCYIEDKEDYLNCIISTVRNIDNWLKLDLEVRREQINWLVKPFKIKDNTIDFLVNYNS